MGVFDGILSGLREYLRRSGASEEIVKKCEFYNGVVLVCCVRGRDVELVGASRSNLRSTIIEKQAREIIQGIVCDYLEANREIAVKILEEDNDLWFNKL